MELGAHLLLGIHPNQASLHGFCLSTLECAWFGCEGQNFPEVIFKLIGLVNNFPQKPLLLTRT